MVYSLAQDEPHLSATMKPMQNSSGRSLAATSVSSSQISGLTENLDDNERRSATGKKKKSKLEKIYELQASNRALKEESRSLRVEKQEMKKKLAALEKALHNTTGSLDEGSVGAKSHGVPSTGSVPDDLRSRTDEKFKEAMKALKRVTVNQEKSLNILRSKLEQSKYEISDRDETIATLTKEKLDLKAALATSGGGRQASEDGKKDLEDQLARCRAEVEDLDIQCKERTKRTMALTLQLEESNAKVKHLQQQVDSAKKLITREASTRSVKSIESTESTKDVVRLKKQLAAKIERIVLLEFEIEVLREELQDLKDSKMINEAFPSKNDANIPEFDADFFSDDEEEDEDLWS